MSFYTILRLSSGGKPASSRNARPGYRVRRRWRRQKGERRRPRARPTNTGGSEIEDDRKKNRKMKWSRH